MEQKSQSCFWLQLWGEDEAKSEIQSLTPEISALLLQMYLHKSRYNITITGKKQKTRDNIKVLSEKLETYKQ